MNFKLTLLTMIYLGTLTACSNSTKDEETATIKTSKVEAIMTSHDSAKVEKTNKSETENKDDADKKESKAELAFKAEIESLENKQKKLELISSLDEERLKNSHKALLQQLQELKWEQEMLSQKLELKKAKDEEATYEIEKKEAADKKKEEKEEAEAKKLKEKEKEKYEAEKAAYEREKELYERDKERLAREQDKFEQEKAKHEQETYAYERLKEAKQKELDVLEHKASLVEVKSKQFETETTLARSIAEYKESQLASAVSLLKAKQLRENYITVKPEYLDNPLSDDNRTLTISDRRIELNGAIYDDLSNRVTSQISYYNNKDSSKPIFIVIDSSPGGSMMSGYMILRAMESSKAPIYVVLKSFSASMASVIVTLADKSFAYPNAVMLHHQPIGVQFGGYNLTEQKESYKNLEKWWKAFGKPVADKMGITLEEFQKKMYENASTGDWSEFAEDAQKLHWVNNTIDHIIDNSVLVNPLHDEEEEEDWYDYEEDDDDYEDKVKNAKGTVKKIKKHKHHKRKKVMYLPRISPKDVYFIYNPDGYYKLR